MTPIRRLDHIAIAVADTDAALTYFRDVLGLTVAHCELNAAAGVRLTYLDAGNAWLQLVEPLSDESPVATHVREHGDGLHHICFAVDHVERDARALGDGDAVRVGSGRGRPAAFVPGAVQRTGAHRVHGLRAPGDDDVRSLGCRRRRTARRGGWWSSSPTCRSRCSTSVTTCSCW